MCVCVCVFVESHGKQQNCTAQATHTGSVQHTFLLLLPKRLGHGRTGKEILWRSAI